MLAFNWFIAWRYLWSKRTDSFISIIRTFSLLGIALGVATLIVVMSVMNGFRHELTQKVLDFNSHLSIFDGEGEFEDYGKILSSLKEMPEVLEAIPVLEGQGLLSAKGKSLGVMIKAFPYEDLQRREVLFKKNLVGDFAAFQNAGNTIALGMRLAEKLRVRVGDTVSFLSPDGNVTPFGVMPRLQSFKVVALFESGMFEYDSTTAFISFASAQTFFQKGMGIDHIDLFLKNPHQSEKNMGAIQHQLSRPLKFLSWTEAHASFFEIVKIERNVMFIILTMIILVAVFNIVSGLVMLVKDKTQDIAILKTMGASQASILKIFLCVGSLIGILGTLSGVLLGICVAFNLERLRQFVQSITGSTLFNQEFYFLTELPVVVNNREILGICIMSIGFSFLATLYPAWRAAKLNPVQALRYE
jgi:lipoprotein-releasing system permease protein